MGSSIVVNDIYAEAIADVSTIPAYYDIPETDPEQRTVPAGEAWTLLGAVVELTTTADVGNRTVALQVVDADGAIFYETAVNSNVAASQTDARQSFLIDGPTSASGNQVELAKGIVVPPGLTVQAVDKAAIAAGDVINLKLVVNRKLFAQ